MNSERYELANDHVSLVINGRGHLLALTNQHTGHNYLAVPAPAPWRLFYRSGDALDLEIAPHSQQVQIRTDAKGLVFHYATLQSTLAHQPDSPAVPNVYNLPFSSPVAVPSVAADQPYPAHRREAKIELQVRVELDDDRLIWTATIDNREADVVVTELWLPWLASIGDLGLGQAADILYWPQGGGRRIPNPLAHLARTRAHRGVMGYWEPEWFRLTYPWPASMQWYTLNNGEEGIYVGSHDRTLMTTCLNLMAHADDSLSATIIKYPFVDSGECWTAEPVVVRLYGGDWHEAARTYRRWADTWMQLPSPPAWVRRAPGWVKFNPKTQYGHSRGTYADFPSILTRAQSVGISVLAAFGWVAQGFDNRYPHYNPDEAMGGAAGLTEALAQVEKAGGNVILYTQGQLIDPSTEWYRREGHRITTKDIWGYEYREKYSFHGEGSLLQVMQNKYFGHACASAPGWLDQLQAQYELVEGLGAQGILYDQMGGITPYLCFSTEHGHAKPSLAIAPAKVRNMAHLRQAIKGQDPEFAFSIELISDCYCQYADIIHGHGPGYWITPDAFGELFRYTFPEPVITNRADVRGDRQKHFGHAFTLGHRFDANLPDTEDPEVAAYLSRLCEIRNQHPELLLEGRFVDNEGFVCDNDAISTHAFVAEEQLAVVLWNPAALPQTFQIVAPGHILQRAIWQDPGRSGLDHALRPGEVAVQIFRRR